MPRRNDSSDSSSQVGADEMLCIEIMPMSNGEESLCEQVLRALPDWFGIEEAIVQYVRDTTAHPTWLALADGKTAGFITLRRHTPKAAEIHCMAVLPQFHRRGIGREMIVFAEAYLSSEGVEYLQVKTQGPSRPCEHYDQTRRFYEAMGFVALEEFPNLWPGNPCLMLVKRIG